jgi:hypothetical protein
MIDAASRLAVTINVAPALEERVVDWLLAGYGAQGFSALATYGHGGRHDEMSVAEQVSGRQRRVELRAEIAADALDAFLGDLTACFGGADVYYVVTPVLASGHLRPR